MASIDTDTIWRVTGQSADGEWVRIDYQGQNVWINATLVCLMNGNIWNVPVVAG